MSAGLRGRFHVGKTHLARADFVESDEGECLRKHSASQVFLGQKQRRHDEGEQNLWEESE